MQKQLYYKGPRDVNNFAILFILLKIQVHLFSQYLESIYAVTNWSMYFVSGKRNTLPELINSNTGNGRIMQ